jgi:hypothetical protein
MGILILLTGLFRIIFYISVIIIAVRLLKNLRKK